MNQDQIETWKGNTFTGVNIGSFSELDKYTYTLPALSKTVHGKLFLNEMLGLTGCEISFNTLPPKKSMPFYHIHQKHEEVYIFLSGEGEFQIDGKMFSVKEGTVVRVHPDGERTWRNVSPSEGLTYIVIQAPADQIKATHTSDGIAVEKRVSWVNKETA